jgi:hypothetical protein
MIQAIETEYKGYRFRSRLEARWAVFFDALGIEYKYEPEGFEKVWGPETFRYLPDFLLTKSETWVEVKGSDEQLREERERMESFLDFGSPLPNFDDSHLNNNPNKAHGLLMLGEIPDPTQFGLYLHPLIQHHKGLLLSRVFFYPSRFASSIARVDSETMCIVEMVTGADHRDNCYMEGAKDWTTAPLFLPTRKMWHEVLDAYRAARSARFEYGECGAQRAAS